jgi:hypothetical protein
VLRSVDLAAAQKVIDGARTSGAETVREVLSEWLARQTA